MKGREAHSQLGKTGAYGETDLAVALLGFASSPGNQAALKTARVTPRSESSDGPLHLNHVASAALHLRAWLILPRQTVGKNYRNVRESSSVK